ncbi:MAG: trimethylamine methyltransferase family protein [Chloroflexota bacterium]
MTQSDIIRPRLGVLSAAQMQRLHQASLDILSTVGLRVDSEAARQIFGRAIGRLDPSADQAGGDRVRIPPDLVAQALATAPRRVEIFDRRGNLAFCLGSDEPTRFGIGVTALYFQNPLTDAVTPFTRAHMAASVRLGDALPGFDAVSTVGIVQDAPPEVSDLYAALEMTANTIKPLVLLVSDEDRFPDVLDLLAHLHGDLAGRPFIMPYFNPITPLVLNQGTADKMMLAIERGLPFIYSNYGMAGASTPITPAGALALLNAELLAGLVFSQLVRAGAPIILGCLPAYFDMKGMGSFYDAHSYLIDLACAEMMAFYRLPHAGTSGSGMGWGGDLIAAGHQWINHLTSCLGKAGLVPFVGDNLGSKAFSPTVVVLADEIITQARRLAAGFPLDEDALAMDEIAAVGPGGDYLTSPLTLKHFRRAYFQSHLWPNLTLEAWQERGSPRADDALRQRTAELMAGAAPPRDHEALMARGEAFIQRRS